MDWMEFWEYFQPCDICFALVPDSQYNQHERWHRMITIAIEDL